MPNNKSPANGNQDGRQMHKPMANTNQMPMTNGNQGHMPMGNAKCNRKCNTNTMKTASHIKIGKEMKGK